MPELPEVETTRRGIAPLLEGRTVTAVHVRHASLRRPIPLGLDAILTGQPLSSVRRRAKYLLLDFPPGCLILHLGMSGSLRVAGPDEPAARHDHLDLCFGERVLRLHDPRRFGLVHWAAAGLCEEGSPLAKLGIEPLDPEFSGHWLYRATRHRKTPIKLFLMDAQRVVGVGNIYASECLFRAGIDPRAPATSLGPRRCARLVEALRATLEEAIEAGGSTLRDFTGGDGRPGYFQHSHAVYGRAAAPCLRCGGAIERLLMGQRSTFFCPRCQRR